MRSAGESPRNLAKLAEPESYLAGHAGKLVILDEIHRVPELFQPLRGLIDEGRRQGRGTGRFLFLGSASMDVLRQSSETLAGRISYVELHPFDVLEVPADATNALWLRGGFPRSFLSEDDEASLRWRLDFVQTYLERDMPQFGARLSAQTLRRFWTMLAHKQGGLLNKAQLACSLGVDGKTVSRYLDLLVDLLLVRRLAPWHRNPGKRLVRSPRVFVRDSGLVHALLGLQDLEELLGHPVVGQSWEGFVIESLLSVLPERVEASFYRTSGGAEIDLVLSWPGSRLWAIEIKRGLIPRVGRGFHAACADIKPERRVVVYSGDETYPMGNDVEATGLRSLALELAAMRGK